MATNMAYFYYESNGTPYDEDEAEVIVYGMELLISTILEALAILAIGIIAGKTLETLAFFAAFMPLRLNAGGYHAKTHLKCFCGVLMIYAAFLLIQFLVPLWMVSNLLLIITFVSAIPIFLLAPLPDKNKPIGPIQRKKFRKTSLIIYFIQAAIIILLSFTGIIPYIALGFAVGQLSASGSIVAAAIRDSWQGA